MTFSLPRAGSPSRSATIDATATAVLSALFALLASLALPSTSGAQAVGTGRIQDLDTLRVDVRRGRRNHSAALPPQ